MIEFNVWLVFFHPNNKQSLLQATTLARNSKCEWVCVQVLASRSIDLQSNVGPIERSRTKTPDHEKVPARMLRKLVPATIAKRRHTARRDGAHQQQQKMHVAIFVSRLQIGCGKRVQLDFLVRMKSFKFYRGVFYLCCTWAKHFVYDRRLFFDCLRLQI